MKHLPCRFCAGVRGNLHRKEPAPDSGGETPALQLLVWVRRRPVCEQACVSVRRPCTILYRSGSTATPAYFTTPSLGRHLADALRDYCLRSAHTNTHPHYAYLNVPTAPSRVGPTASLDAGRSPARRPANAKFKIQIVYILRGVYWSRSRSGQHTKNSFQPSSHLSLSAASGARAHARTVRRRAQPAARRSAGGVPRRRVIALRAAQQRA